MRSGARGYRGVVFDFDGTLLDSMPLVLEGMAEVVARYRPRPDRHEVLASLGGPSEACLRRLLGAEEHVPEALARYVAFFSAHDEMTRLFRGARRLLADLRRAGIPLGIWTGRERSLTEARLRGLKLDRQFDPWICGDDLDSHKPDPEGLLEIVKVWGLAIGEVLFVGDSDQDLAGAAAAEAPMVMIRHGRVIPPGLAAHPIATVDTPAEAYTWIRHAVLGR